MYVSFYACIIFFVPYDVFLYLYVKMFYDGNKNKQTKKDPTCTPMHGCTQAMHPKYAHSQYTHIHWQTKNLAAAFLAAKNNIMNHYHVITK